MNNRLIIKEADDMSSEYDFSSFKERKNPYIGRLPRQAHKSEEDRLVSQKNTGLRRKIVAVKPKTVPTAESEEAAMFPADKVAKNSEEQTQREISPASEIAPAQSATYNKNRTSQLKPSNAIDEENIDIPKKKKRGRPAQEKDLSEERKKQLPVYFTPAEHDRLSMVCNHVLNKHPMKDFCREYIVAGLDATFRCTSASCGCRFVLLDEVGADIVCPKCGNKNPDHLYQFKFSV